MSFWPFSAKFASYRDLYRAEADRTLKLESEITDLRVENAALRERAERAESERTEVYRKFINWQAVMRNQAPIFGPFDDLPPAPPQPELEPMRTTPISGAEARVGAYKQFFEDLEREIAI